jgi:phage portal protein BeeE
VVNLLRTLIQPGEVSRYSLGQYISDVSQMYYYGATGGAGIQETYDKKEQPKHSGDFEGMVQGGYRRNGVVFACQMARMRIFTEARFQFQTMRRGRPAELFGTAQLARLENPWPNGTTGELLARMLQDVDLAGNWFGRKTGPLASANRLERLRPDWMAIVLGSNRDLLTAELAGYIYYPDGPESKTRPVILAAEEVAHWSPIPDPLASYRGMSWLTPVLRDIAGDSAATDHKLAFWEHAATPNLVFKMDPNLSEDAFKKFKAMVESNHAGALNSWKNLYIGGAADVTVAGSNFKDMDLRQVQGAGETRIAAAAGVPPIIAGLSEGLNAATYSNYAQARRAFADLTLRPLWRSAAAALAPLVDVPAGARLWYDDRDIAFLHDDRADAAQAQATQAGTISTLVNAGFEPESVKAAVDAEDFSLLKHSGLMSVQLLPPGSDGTTTPPKEVTPDG